MDLWAAVVIGTLFAGGHVALLLFSGAGERYWEAILAAVRGKRTSRTTSLSPTPPGRQP